MSLKSVKKYCVDRCIPEILSIRLKFKKNVGYFPNLKNPKTFNEKMQWLKIHDRSELHSMLTDKYLARNILTEIVGEEYLVPLCFQSYNPKDIIPDNLPNYPCIIKTNHDCGGNKIIYDKTKVNWEEIQIFFRKRLKTNYYYWGREWQYKHIKPCIIVEQLLLDNNNNIPFDYKVYCFNGMAKMITVDKDRGKPSQSRHWYNIKWEEKDIYWNTKGDNSIIIKPKLFNKMIQLSEKIGKKFRFARIDWFIVDDTLYIGEVTFHPGGGLVKFYPKKWDKIFGELLNLNSKHET